MPAVPRRWSRTTAIATVLGLLLALFAGALPASAASGDFTIAAESKNEGTGGTTVFTFIVTVEGPYTGQVDYTTESGTATAGEDFVPKSGTLTFLPGATTQNIEVTVNGDAAPESNETFTVRLSNPVPGSCSECTATATIINDDGVAPVVSVGSDTVTEGTGGAAPTADFAVTLDKAPTEGADVTVSYTTNDGTAMSTEDYTATIGILTFTAGGPLTQTVSVGVSPDARNEATETFTLTITPTNATCSACTGTATINDDDTVPTISVADVTAAEGTSETATTFAFPVTLSAASGREVTVAYTTTDGTAVAGSDYATTAGTLTFAAGETTKTVDVPVVADASNEPNETFTVTLSAPSSATLADPSATGTITDDDVDPTLSINDRTVDEGDAGTTVATFTVTLNPASGLGATVDYRTVDGTGTSAEDFVATAGTLSFAAGETSKTVDVTISGDTLNEPTETFTVVLENAQGATLADGEGLGTITNDDDLPGLSISDAGAPEGASGEASTATFTITLSEPSGQQVTADVTTSDGTATAGADYTALTGAVVTFAPGDTSETITVTVNGDETDEPDETFDVTLSGATNATITDATGVGTITDDDAGPTFAINDAFVTEFDGAGASLVFTVTKTGATSSTITVPFSTADGTAVGGQDYTATADSLTFAPGETTKQITVPVTGDSISEPDETMFVNLATPSSGTTTDAEGVGTIQDDEGDPPPALTIGDRTVAEDAVTATFTVTRTANPEAGEITVDFTTQDGSAVAGQDFTATTGTLVIPADQTSGTISVPITSDTTDEPNETFTVVLSNARNASIADGTATGTITDDDAAPVVSAGPASVTEASDGTSVDLAFTVSLSNASTEPVTVAYATSDGTATAGSDYTTSSGTLTFDPGQTEKTVTVAVLGDDVDEAAETLLLTLSAATNATLGGTNPATGTINDDDAPPIVSIGDITLTEGDDGTTTATFTVTKTGATQQTVTVRADTADGTATAPADYTAVSGTVVSFGPGETIKTVAVPVVADTLDEANETFDVNLSAASNATISDTDGTGTGTITDDDAATATLSIGNATVTEGNAGTTNATFTITKTGATGQAVTVVVDTTDGTATAGSDYTAINGQTVTFAVTETTKDVTVAITGDTLDEPNETFTVVLSEPTNATIGDGTGAGTITDDDAATATLSIGNATVTEGDAGTTNATFTITKTGATGQAVTVVVDTTDGTATAGSDYTAINGQTVTFAPTETTKDVTVAITGDTLDEPNETFTVVLSEPTNATIGDGTGAGTITDDDAATATLSISNATVTEGNAGTTNATFTVTLSAPSGQTVTVNYGTSNGTATAPDYSSTSGTLTFVAGDTSETIRVVVKGDTLDEANERFTVLLTSPANASIADGSGTGTITDDDAPAPQPQPEPQPQPSEPAQGYSLVGEDGSLYAYGTAKNLGDMRGTKLNAPIIGVAYTPGGKGYWLVAKDGGIFTFGNAEFFGSMGDKTLNSPVIGMAATPTGQGYWLFAGDGGIFTFGDAEFFGSMGDQKLNQPVINMEPLESGNGYWLVAADGGIFTFGQAEFFGSMGDQKINQPIFDMTSTDTDDGYWLVARDGGIFSFGDAAPKFYGSAVNENPRPTKVIGMDSTPGSLGYWIADASGKVYPYGNAQPLGDRYQANNPAPMIGFASVPGLNL